MRRRERKIQTREGRSPEPSTPKEYGLCYTQFGSWPKRCKHTEQPRVMSGLGLNAQVDRTAV